MNHRGSHADRDFKGRSCWPTHRKALDVVGRPNPSWRSPNHIRARRRQYLGFTATGQTYDISSTACNQITLTSEDVFLGIQNDARSCGVGRSDQTHTERITHRDCTSQCRYPNGLATPIEAQGLEPAINRFWQHHVQQAILLRGTH